MALPMNMKAGLASAAAVPVFVAQPLLAVLLRSQPQMRSAMDLGRILDFFQLTTNN